MTVLVIFIGSHPTMHLYYVLLQDPCSRLEYEQCHTMITLFYSIIPACNVGEKGMQSRYTLHV